LSLQGTADAQRTWRRKSLGRKSIGRKSIGQQPARGLGGWGRMDAKALVQVQMDYDQEELGAVKPGGVVPTWRRPGSLADCPPNTTNPLLQVHPLSLPPSLAASPVFSTRASRA
jgi:hypothetical protein